MLQLDTSLEASLEARLDDWAPNSALDKLIGAAGAYAFYDFDTGYTLNAGNVSALASRVGSHVVSQASGGAQPVWGVQSPTGRRGATFAGAQWLFGSPDVGVAGATPYSALWVARFSAIGADRVVWGASNSGSVTDTLYEGMLATTGADIRWRADTALANTFTSGGTHTTTIAMVTTDYSGSTCQSWINGSLAINAALSRAPAVDLISIGARKQNGVWGRGMLGDIYTVIIAPRWSTQQRQDCEGLAKEWWGTP